MAQKIIIGMVLPFALFVISSFAHAADDKKNERMKTCIFKSGAYETAATFRDHDYSPEDALKNMKLKYPTLDESFLKIAINNVYFDKDYAYAGGEALQMQMMDLCMNGPKKWKPLK